MASPTDEPWYSFIFTWGFIEWTTSVLWATAIAVAGWAMQITKRMDKLTTDVEYLKVETKRVEDRLITSNNNSNHSREELKSELLAKISDLPTRGFIEHQLTSLTNRIDRLMDSKLRGRSD